MYTIIYVLLFVYYNWQWLLIVRKQHTFVIHVLFMSVWGIIYLLFKLLLSEFSSVVMKMMIEYYWYLLFWSITSIHVNHNLLHNFALWSVHYTAAAKEQTQNLHLTLDRECNEGLKPGSTTQYYKVQGHLKFQQCR